MIEGDVIDGGQFDFNQANAKDHNENELAGSTFKFGQESIHAQQSPKLSEVGRVSFAKKIAEVINSMSAPLVIDKESIKAFLLKLKADNQSLSQEHSGEGNAIESPSKKSERRKSASDEDNNSSK